MANFKDKALALAEVFDAWRVVPRIMLLTYGYLVMHLYSWYRAIPIYVQTKCDGAVLEVLLGRDMNPIFAKELACNVIGTVGGPSSEQSMFASIIIGLSTGIFALYTTTGRKWGAGTVGGDGPEEQISTEGGTSDGEPRPRGPFRPPSRRH